MMASFLGEYPGCAERRDEKFLRAVGSVMRQDWEDKLLVIVSDGCPRTVELYRDLMKVADVDNIHLVELPKQPYLSGQVRMAGIAYAKELGAEVICYLDTDDYLEREHLSNIAKGFEEHKRCSWIWYDDRLATGRVRVVTLARSRIGTSNIAHRAGVAIRWGDGYGHDWAAIAGMMGERNAKCAMKPGYVVCHIPNQLDE